MSDKNIKDTENKPKLSLVPTAIIRGIAQVREYGNQKYRPDSWREVEPQEYVDAAYRHLLAIVDGGIGSVDKESGLLHVWHLACNVAFLCEAADHFANVKLDGVLGGRG